MDTLADLAAAHPADAWRLVIGADNLDDFPRWREADRLQRLAEVVVMPRGGARPRLPAGADPARFILVDDFDEPVSSTGIRAMLAAGSLPTDALPAAVAAHIRARGLYGIGRR